MSKCKLAVVQILVLFFALPVYLAAQRRVYGDAQKGATQKSLPVISSLSPTSTTAGTGVLLTVNGSNFANGSLVIWNSLTQTTTFVSSSQLRISVTSAMVGAAATAKVAVYTAGRNGGTSGTLSFTINPAPTTTTTTTTTTTSPLAITTTSIPIGTTGTAYSATLTASGGTSPYSWSVGSGALPPGLTLSSAGALSGIPTTSGSYSFMASAKDAASGTTSYTYSTMIAAGTTTPLSVTTASVPNGSAGTAYPTTSLAATGGTSPYTWSVATGSALPAGLALSAAGAITGIPTTAATYSFSAQAKDSASNTATHVYSMTVVAATTTSVSSAAVAMLPQFVVNASLPDTTGYVVKTVCASGCDYSTVQAAVNAIHTDGGDAAGEVIELASGVTFTEHVNFPAYGMAAGKWVMVTTNTSPSNLPAPGVRISPSYSAVLAKIITNSTSNLPAVQIASQANSYWFMGLEIAAAPSVSLFTDAVFKIGAAETSVAALPFNIVIDRCYIHGNLTGNIRRGVKADGVSVAVINSFISDIHDTGSDTQAIWAYNTPGPILIQNNELQASGENVMFGAADPAIANLIPSDITVTNNHFFKPLSWFSGSSSYAGILWIVKDLFEIKNAQRVLLQGNVFENNWAQAQVGFAFQLTPRNASGGCTWCADADVTIAYNIIRHSGSAINIGGADCSGCGGLGPSQPSQRINIHDNLFQDINGPNWGGAAGTFIQVLNTSQTLSNHDITINHNTVFQTGKILSPAGGPVSGEYTTANFVFTNNINPHNAYGVIGTGTGAGTLTLTAYFPGAVFTKNVLENIAASGVLTCANYPAGNFCPAAWTNLPFVDSTNCPAGYATTSTIGICALMSSSTYLTSGTDSRPLGVDINGLGSVTSGVAP